MNVLGRKATIRVICAASACAIAFPVPLAYADAGDGGEAEPAVDIANPGMNARATWSGKIPASSFPLFGSMPRLGVAPLVDSAPRMGNADGGAEETLASAAEPVSSVDPRSAAQIEELLQYPELPAGCESVALACVLRSMGFDASGTEIVDEYLAIDPTCTDFVTSFAGDPYWGGGTLPPAIVDAANAYLAAQGDAASGLAARDLTGLSYENLLVIVGKGYPVLVWTTMYGEEPAFTGEVVDGWSWYFNEHCVVLYGIEGSEVLVSDPLEGLVKRDTSEFGYLYEACGSMAVAIE